MYFQVCSNSANPQHSGERYRGNGPLVLYLRCKLGVAFARRCTCDELFSLTLAGSVCRILITGMNIARLLTVSPTSTD